MQLYFVRHGETGGNVAHRHQADKTLLTPRGVAQAKAAAATIETLGPTHLLTSQLVRAVETAEIIGQICGLIPETSVRFIELARPAHLYGYSHYSPRSVWFYFLWYFGLTKNGESYSALRARFLAAKAELAAYPPEACVVVVSHAVFINLFLAHLCRERALSPWAALCAFYRLLTMPNAAIVSVQYAAAAPPGCCPWRQTPLPKSVLPTVPQK